MNVLLTIIDSRIGPPSVHTIKEESNNEMLLKWKTVDDPRSLFSHYTVYQQTMKGFTIKQHTPNLEAIVPSSRQLDDVRIIANSQQPLQNVIYLPSIGKINSMIPIVTIIIILIFIDR